MTLAAGFAPETTGGYRQSRSQLGAVLGGLRLSRPRDRSDG